MIRMLILAGAALMALATLAYVRWPRPVEYRMDYYEGDDGWETEGEWYEEMRRGALDHRGLP